MIALVVIIFLVSRRMAVTKPKALAVGATLAYLVVASTAFFVDILQYRLMEAIPLYVVCFVLLPIIVYTAMIEVTKRFEVRLVEEPATTPEEVAQHDEIAEKWEEHRQPSPFDDDETPAFEEGYDDEYDTKTSDKRDYTIAGTYAEWMSAKIAEDEEEAPPTEEEPTEEEATPEMDEAASEGEDIFVEGLSDMEITAEIEIVGPNEAEAPAPADSESDSASSTSYEVLMSNAEKLKIGHHYTAAAHMYEKAAKSARDNDEKVKALFSALTCYVKEKRTEKAIGCAERLKLGGQLTPQQTSKLELTLRMLSK